MQLKLTRTNKLKQSYKKYKTLYNRNNLNIKSKQHIKVGLTQQKIKKHLSRNATDNYLAVKMKKNKEGGNEGILSSCSLHPSRHHGPLHQPNFSYWSLQYLSLCFSLCLFALASTTILKVIIMSKTWPTRKDFILEQNPCFDEQIVGSIGIICSNWLSYSMFFVLLVYLSFNYLRIS